LRRQGRTTKHWLDISMLEGTRRRLARMRRRPARRQRRVKATRMSELGGSSPPRVVPRPLPPPASFESLLVYDLLEILYVELM
jgi:hypothetical protein